MRILAILSLIIGLSILVSCNTTQEARVCPMWNQKFQADTLSSEVEL